MCTVSAMTGYFQNKPQTTWNHNSWADFQKILKLLEELDRKLDQPDCIDPEKDKWLKEMSELWDKANKE